jgi:hypothetical protein
MERQLNERINIEIMENEKGAHDWSLNKLATELYWWCNFFNNAFFKGQPVPVPALSFERTKVNTLGHYVSGRNQFVLLENININRAHLSRPLWDILATLLHEMVHSWQGTYGNPSNSWFHNREFRLKMAEIGILCNEKGCHVAVGDPFVSLLKEHGMKVSGEENPDGMIKFPPKDKTKGKSKLKKWTCGCQNARVGKATFEAICDICGSKFELVE